MRSLLQGGNGRLVLCFEAAHEKHDEADQQDRPHAAAANCGTSKVKPPPPNKRSKQESRGENSSCKLAQLGSPVYGVISPVLSDFLDGRTPRQKKVVGYGVDLELWERADRPLREIDTLIDFNFGRAAVAHAHLVLRRGWSRFRSAWGDNAAGRRSSGRSPRNAGRRPSRESVRRRWDR